MKQSNKISTEGETGTVTENKINEISEEDIIYIGLILIATLATYMNNNFVVLPIVIFLIGLAIFKRIRELIEQKYGS